MQKYIIVLESIPKLNEPSNSYISTNTTHNWEKLPQKSAILIAFKKYDKYWVQNFQKQIVHLGL